METDDLLPISALEHLLYCKRQCALIHVDGVWIENGSTAAGRALHERVDDGGLEARPGVRMLRAVWLRSERLGLRGIADVVEVLGSGENERLVPVEYKRGARGKKLHDDVQVCAQAMALEEMTGRVVAEGAVYYAKTRRRRVVAIDGALRARTEESARELRAMVTGGRVPEAVLDARCEDCSLRGACVPERTGEKSERGALARSLRDALR